MKDQNREHELPYWFVVVTNPTGTSHVFFDINRDKYFTKETAIAFADETKQKHGDHKISIYNAKMHRNHKPETCTTNIVQHPEAVDCVGCGRCKHPDQDCCNHCNYCDSTYQDKK